MVDGPSSVSIPSQQPDIQGVQRTRPVPEQRQDSMQVSGGKGSQAVNQSEEAKHEQRPSLAELDMDQLIDIKDSLNKALGPINMALNFEDQDDVEDLVVKVINKDTDEVIRQIPPEAMIKMAQRIDEMTGLLVNTWR